MYTDHKPLLSFFVGEVANTKIQRWAILLAEFGIKIKYQPGKNNVRADMLSCIRSVTDEVNILDTASEWLTPEQVKAHLPPNIPLLTDVFDAKELLLAQEQEFP